MPESTDNLVWNGQPELAQSEARFDENWFNNEAQRIIQPVIRGLTLRRNDFFDEKSKQLASGLGAVEQHANQQIDLEEEQQAFNTLTESNESLEKLQKEAQYFEFSIEQVQERIKQKSGFSGLLKKINKIFEGRRDDDDFPDAYEDSSLDEEKEFLAKQQERLTKIRIEIEAEFEKNADLFKKWSQLQEKRTGITIYSTIPFSVSKYDILVNNAIQRQEHLISSASATESLDVNQVIKDEIDEACTLVEIELFNFLEAENARVLARLANDPVIAEFLKQGESARAVFIKAIQYITSSRAEFLRSEILATFDLEVNTDTVPESGIITLPLVSIFSAEDFFSDSDLRLKPDRMRAFIHILQYAGLLGLVETADLETHLTTTSTDLINTTTENDELDNSIVAIVDFAPPEIQRQLDQKILRHVQAQIKKGKFNELPTVWQKLTEQTKQRFLEDTEFKAFFEFAHSLITLVSCAQPSDQAAFADVLIEHDFISKNISLEGMRCVLTPNGLLELLDHGMYQVFIDLVSNIDTFNLVEISWNNSQKTILTLLSQAIKLGITNELDALFSFLNSDIVEIESADEQAMITVNIPQTEVVETHIIAIAKRVVEKTDSVTATFVDDEKSVILLLLGETFTELQHSISAVDLDQLAQMSKANPGNLAFSFVEILCPSVVENGELTAQQERLIAKLYFGYETLQLSEEAKQQVLLLCKENESLKVLIAGSLMKRLSIANNALNTARTLRDRIQVAGQTGSLHFQFEYILLSQLLDEDSHRLSSVSGFRRFRGMPANKTLLPFIEMVRKGDIAVESESLQHFFVILDELNALGIEIDGDYEDPLKLYESGVMKAVFSGEDVGLDENGLSKVFKKVLLTWNISEIGVVLKSLLGESELLPQIFDAQQLQLIESIEDSRVVGLLIRLMTQAEMEGESVAKTRVERRFERSENIIKYLPEEKQFTTAIRDEHYYQYALDLLQHKPQLESLGYKVVVGVVRNENDLDVDLAALSLAERYLLPLFDDQKTPISVSILASLVKNGILDLTKDVDTGQLKIRIDESNFWKLAEINLQLALMLKKFSDSEIEVEQINVDDVTVPSTFTSDVAEKMEPIQVGAWSSQVLDLSRSSLVEVDGAMMIANETLLRRNLSLQQLYDLPLKFQHPQARNALLLFSVLKNDRISASQQVFEQSSFFSSEEELLLFLDLIEVTEGKRIVINFTNVSFDRLSRSQNGLSRISTKIPWLSMYQLARRLEVSSSQSDAGISVEVGDTEEGFFGKAHALLDLLQAGSSQNTNADFLNNIFKFSTDEGKQAFLTVLDFSGQNPRLKIEGLHELAKRTVASHVDNHAVVSFLRVLRQAGVLTETLIRQLDLEEQYFWTVISGENKSLSAMYASKGLPLFSSEVSAEERKAELAKLSQDFTRSTDPESKVGRITLKPSVYLAIAQEDSLTARNVLSSEYGIPPLSLIVSDPSFNDMITRDNIRLLKDMQRMYQGPLLFVAMLSKIGISSDIALDMSQDLLAVASDDESQENAIEVLIDIIQFRINLTDSILASVVKNRPEIFTKPYLAAYLPSLAVAFKQGMPEEFAKQIHLVCPALFLQEQSQLREFVQKLFHDYSYSDELMWVKTKDDLDFISRMIGKHGGITVELLKGYQRSLEAGILTHTSEGKQAVFNLTEEFRVVTPSIMKAYLSAVETKQETLFFIKLRALAKKITGGGKLSDADRELEYLDDLIRSLYQNNSGERWTTFEDNLRCEDRTRDIEQFSFEEEYELEIASSGGVKIRDGKKVDKNAVKRVEERVYEVSRSLDLSQKKEVTEQQFDQDLEVLLERIEGADLFNGFSFDALSSNPEKRRKEILFLLIVASAFDSEVFSRKEISTLLIKYEFIFFVDIREYIEGTNERVSQSKNPEYALLMELHAFFSDRIKDIQRDLLQTSVANSEVNKFMESLFVRFAQKVQEETRKRQVAELRVEGLGLNEQFVSRLTKMLNKQKKRAYTNEQVKKLISRYERMTNYLEDETKSDKPISKAFEGQLRSQRERSLYAMQVLSGKSLDPRVHLGELNLAQYLDARIGLETMEYDQDMFEDFLVQEMLSIFEKERAVIETEALKYESIDGVGSSKLIARFSKSETTAHARMVAGVCVAGDNPSDSEPKPNLWEMENYFELVLTDPESLRCVGTLLLHHFEENGKKILTVSFNPSSTYLYKVDEGALFNALMNPLIDFAGKNDFDMIGVSTHPNIRTNRTAGLFEKTMDKQIQRVGKQYMFDKPKTFSYSPNYIMEDIDLLWEKAS